MKCPECNCKFKEKFQLWTEDNEVVCPVCKCYIKVEPKNYFKGENINDCKGAD